MAAGEAAPLIAVAAPLRGEGRLLVQIVLIAEQIHPLSAMTHVCAALYRLTQAEAALLPPLLRGLTPREIAEEQGVKLPTIRTHLSRMFLKTGTRRQSELVQRLLRVAALVPS